jgi:hypothetical protein
MRRRKRADRSGGVGMAVDDLPLAVLAAVEVGDAQGERRERDAVHGAGDVSWPTV